MSGDGRSLGGEYRTTPEQRERVRAILSRRQAESLETASRRGAAWTQADDDVLRTDLSTHDAAERLGRTFWAVTNRRRVLDAADAAGVAVDYANEREVASPSAARRGGAELCPCGAPDDHEPWCPR